MLFFFQLQYSFRENNKKKRILCNGCSDVRGIWAYCIRKILTRNLYTLTDVMESCTLSNSSRDSQQLLFFLPSSSSILWPFVVIRVCVPLRTLCAVSFSNLFFPLLFLPVSHLLTVWSVMLCPLLLRPHSASRLLFWGRTKGFASFFVLQLVKMNFRQGIDSPTFTCTAQSVPFWSFPLFSQSFIPAF